MQPLTNNAPPHTNRPHSPSPATKCLYAYSRSKLHAGSPLLIHSSTAATTPPFTHAATHKHTHTHTHSGQRVYSRQNLAYILEPSHPYMHQHTALPHLYISSCRYTAMREGRAPHTHTPTDTQTPKQTDTHTDIRTHTNTR